MKYLPIFLLLLLVFGVVFMNMSTPKKEYDYFRIHIRANSNLEIDQNVKYQIKDEVVNFVTPYLIDCDTKQKSIEALQNLLPEIEGVCNSALAKSGFNYTASAQINKEYFPTRAYDNITLDSGVYDALIIELGSGEGDNWWCLIYPPLCFVNNNSTDVQNIKYQSYLAKIVKKYFG